MATKKAAESTLYHLSPKGFWKTFRELQMRGFTAELQLLIHPILQETMLL